MASYDDEIDLYGDETHEEPVQQQEDSRSSKQESDSKQDSGYSSIPTFVSEARGGTGVIPSRHSDENAEGFGPKNGDYGSPGQWKTKPISTVRPSDMPEEGKMFVGGLNWETTEESMRKYFEQFGKVTHCTIMRDPATNRSRGFGFLTFEDASAVNVVMVKEHHLDGKIIDPKRAIPRPEVGTTIRHDKIFVRNVPQAMDYHMFKDYFSQFGNIVDSNLMFDRETGLHRGFGFVTYEDTNSVQNALAQEHDFNGHPLEVKVATQKTGPHQSTYVGNRPNYQKYPHQNPNQGGGGGGNQWGQNNYNNNYNQGNNSMGGGMGGGMGGNMGGMGGMGGNMGGGMGSMGNQQGAFDPYAMASFFKQMGWGSFNPMMMMQGGNMMGGAGGAGTGMMPNMMDPSAMMNMMGGMGGMNGMGNMGMGMPNMSGFGSPTSNFGNFSNTSNQGEGSSTGASGSASGSGSGTGNSSGKAPPRGPRGQYGNSGRSNSPSDVKPPAHAPTGPAAMRGGDRESSGSGPVRSSRTSARDHPYR